ncbi:MAG: hypothetical protein CVV51_07385 [Spirochaetae bacterium HGW-Spirochaetae-7]|nr:MAG: hypothetical protein CVV51_07385 [Spirochaetae bacterium HGW-Spirochaetae-7]
MNDTRLPWLSRFPMALAALLAAAGMAAAQTGAEIRADVPIDPFVLEFDAVVAACKAAVDFSAPMDAVRPLSAPAGRQQAPYSLDDLLRLAAAGNPGLKASAAAEAAAAADFSSARARRLPTLKTETTGTYIGNPTDPISIPAGSFPPFGPPNDIVIYEGSGNSLYDFKLVGDLPLFSWGKISLGVDLARTGLGAAALQVRKAERELAVRLRADWDTLAYLGRAGEVLDLQARIGERLVELAGRSVAAGFTTQAELADARISVKEIEMERTKLDERQDRLLSDLASMAGLPALYLADLDLDVPPAGAPRWTEEEIWPMAREGSYDLALAASQLDAKRGLKRLADKEALGLPDIGLHVELSYGGSSLPFFSQGWRDDDDYQLTLSLGASGSLMGNAVKHAEAARAGAELAGAEARYDETERSVQAFIHGAYLGIRLGKARLEHAMLRQEGWAADLGQKRATIRAGAGSESEYLSLMLKALGGLAEAYGTLAEYRSGLLSLEAVVGGYLN